jgi:ankyrin repeat protein
MGRDTSAQVVFQRQLTTGDVDGARKSIQEEACSPTDFNSTGHSPMYYATRGNEPGCVSMLYNEYHVSVTNPCTHPRLDADTPVKVACIAGAVEVLHLLHDLGADCAAPCDRLGNVPARYAVTNNQPECLKILVQYGVTLPDVHDHYGNNLVFFAAMKDEPETLKMLHELGMDLAAPCDAYGYTAACFATINEKTACLKVIHECGVDLNEVCDVYQNTPAKWAVSEDMGEALKTLYLLGVDLAQPCDEYQNTPRELAAKEDNEDIDELLEAMLLPDELKPWVCDVCSLENEPTVAACVVCGAKIAKKPVRVQVPH